MIKLYQYASCWGLPNPSPFCMKLETYLRMAEIPFEIHTISDPRKAPKGKLPFIVDNGQVIADSTLIINYLREKYGDKLDATLTNEQKAQALSLQRLLEEHLYWIIVYSRWIDSAGWSVSKKAYFSFMPSLVRKFVPELIRKDVKKTLRAQGIGRHSQDEIYQFGINDITALAHLLGDKKFFLGDACTSVDASAFASLTSILNSPIESPLKAHAKTFSNLQSYCKRISDAYYSEQHL